MLITRTVNQNGAQIDGHFCQYDLRSCRMSLRLRPARDHLYRLGESHRAAERKIGIPVGLWIDRGQRFCPLSTHAKVRDAVSVQL